MKKRFLMLFLILNILLCSCSNISYSDHPASGNLKVFIINVGQADSILIKSPGGKNMVIDAGNDSDGNKVVAFLKSQNVNTIDVLVGSHPHPDHLGGMDKVLRSFQIGQFYMVEKTDKIKDYLEVIREVNLKNIKVIEAKAGVDLDIDPALKVQMIAPNSKNYGDLNDYSAVIKMTYGKTSFLLAADAEAASEKEMLDKGYNIKADVLKVGHHGSVGSTTDAFLHKVHPKYAVISVGKNNYGFPQKEILDKLKKIGAEVYRTDINGTVTFISDGYKITVAPQK